MTEFGKIPWSFRGIRKCPKCKTFNGHRRQYCKNKACSEIISKEFDKCTSWIDSSKLVTDAPLSIYSVRIRNNGPDYRGFVELRDVESFWVVSNSVQSNSSSGLCYIKNCCQIFNHTGEEKPKEKIINCHHIQASMNSKIIAEPLTLNHAVLSILKINPSMKQEILKLATVPKSPLVQRISKQVIAIKTKKTKRHPLGYLHMLFVQTKKRYYCSCEVFTSKSVRRKEALKRQSECDPTVNPKTLPYNGKCIHFYSCICAFASNLALAKEFQSFIDLVISNEDQNRIIDIIKNKSNINIELEMMDTEPILPPIPEKVKTKRTSTKQSTKTLQDTNAVDLNTDDWKMQENHKKTSVELNDIIFLKAENNSEIVNMCDVFLTEATNEEKNDADKPLDIQIMLTDNPDLMKLPNFIIKEIPLDVKTSQISNENFDSLQLSLLKDLNSNPKSNKESESSGDINNLIADDLTILSDDYNSLEIMSLEQYNYLVNKQGNLNDLINEGLKSSDLTISSTSDLKIKCTSSFSDSDEELLFLGINETDESKTTKSILKSIDVNQINGLTIDSQNKVFELNDDILSEIITFNENAKNDDVNQTIRLTPVENSNLVQNTVGDQIQYSFQQWLGTVTEKINLSMHFQLPGKPDALVYQIPNSFFECFRDRMCHDSRKKRLPNNIIEVNRTDAAPLGKFTKYIWNIVNVNQVKQIFDTDHIPLEITQYFSQNNDGSYKKIEKPNNNTRQAISFDKLKYAKTTNKALNILPGILITFLKVGHVTSNQRSPIPFRIEWTPDLLPKSNVGEMRIKFEFGHKSNYTV